MSYVPKGKTKNPSFRQRWKAHSNAETDGGRHSTDNVTLRRMQCIRVTRKKAGVLKKATTSSVGRTLQQQKDLEELKAKTERVRVHSFKPSDRFGKRTSQGKM